MKVRVKKLSNEAVIPTYGTDGAACFDLTATSINFVESDDYGYVEYGTGIIMEIPKGYEGVVRPRSSISKTGLIMANAPGTIDSDYRGEIFVRFKWIPNSRHYVVGDRIAQMKLQQVQHIEFEEVEELTETVRGTGGFGSTGN